MGVQIDINSDGTVDWDELSTFMIDVGMKGWEDGATQMPSYAYVGQIDAAQPTLAVDQVCADASGQHSSVGDDRE